MEIETRGTTGRNTLLLGRIGIGGGVVGAALALGVLLAPAVVGEDRYSYPFSAGTYAVAQVVFAVQHLAMVAAVLALFAVVRSRVGVGIALVGVVLLTAMEIVAVTAADEPTDGDWAQTVSALYGVPTILVGVGLVVAGVGIVRARPLPGWGRWVTLVTGAYVFVVLIPGLMGPSAVGRIVIGGWMLLFAAMAWAVVRQVAPPASRG